MSTLFKLTATAACIVSAGMLSAQTDDAAASDTAKTPDQVKCHEIVMLDSAVVPGTLYYIAGYRHGSDKASGTGGTAGAADSGSMGDTSATGTDTASSDMASDTTDSSASAQTDTSASATENATSDDAGVGSDDPASASHDAAAGADDGQVEIAGISGFYEIPVEDVLTVCAETPDRNVSDVVNEKRDSAKSDTQ